ncbi:MAG: ABC transporter permease [Bacteroidales bacterium]|nr:ABC transporter permease [Bacteroidales bacterium]MCF8337062.1 ABC transporter permease [Bacteroidales bacterium]
MERIRYLLNIALEAVFLNRTRSILTALGIVFGVAAVIAMLAIGRGAKKEILEQIEMVGVNNIVITPVSDDKSNGDDGDEEGGGQQKESREKYSPGLTFEDAQSFARLIPSVKQVSPQVSYDIPVVRKQEQVNTTLTGVNPNFFEVFNHALYKGSFFSEQQIQKGAPVCIIGPGLKAKLFKKEAPIGKRIKCGPVWMKVIGVLKRRDYKKEASEDFRIRNTNKNIYAPIKTVLVRFKDRSVVTGGMLQGTNKGNQAGASGFINSNKEKQLGNNQLNKIVVQVENSEQLSATRDVIERMLLRRHNEKKDFEITIPELLLQQQQRTKNIFNIVLGAIASISLLVGGIGIMNIMLASVMERIREIGIRLAVGARKRDVVFQFLAEATIISVIGGLMGIVLGVVLAKLINELAGIATIVSLVSIIVSFGVAAAVGIVFGWMPARKAAQQDPVESLRYE